MNTQPIKSGTVRDDGKVFWRYHPRCKNGEHWVSQEQFEVWRSRATSRARRYYRSSKEVLSQEFSARRAEASRRYRDSLKQKRKLQFGNHQFKDRTDEFGVRSFIRGMMLADVPPLPDLRPDQIAMLHAEQSSDWWRDKANSNYPHLPPEE